MSTRAYRVITLTENENASFNLWRDDELCNALNFDDQLGEQGSGIVEIETERLRAALANEKITATLDPKTLATLRQDLADADRLSDKFIMYRCY